MKGRVGLIGEESPEAGPEDPKTNGADQLHVGTDQQLGGAGGEEGAEDPSPGGGGRGAQTKGVPLQGEGEGGRNT